jgi:hypothetical protein
MKRIMQRVICAGNKDIKDIKVHKILEFVGDRKKKRKKQDIVYEYL